MKIKWLMMIWQSLLVFCIAGCVEKETLEITTVKYTSRSGMIPQELQWVEEILITAEKAMLTRKGMTENTQVNAGVWEITLEQDSVNQLFEQLQTVNCSRLKRIEMKNPPIGGGTESYSIIYSNEDTCSLYFDPGTTITGSESIIEPVDEFIRGLEFPPDSVPQHKPPQ